MGMGNIQYYGKSRKGQRMVNRANKLIRRQRRRKNRYFTTINTPNTIVAPSGYYKLKYRSTVSWTSGVTPQTHFFSGSSLYDPDVTGVGGQPMGFDQLMGLYNKYIVYGSKCKVTWNCASRTQNFVLFPQKDSTFGGAIEEAMERPNARTRVSAVYDNISMSAYQSSAGLLGISKSSILGDWGDYGGSSSTNPATRWYWVLVCQDQDKTTSNAVVANVEITYYCKLLERKSLSRS